MLVISRHNLQEFSKYPDKTGVTVGSRDVQIVSVSSESCTVNMNGYVVVAHEGEDLQFVKNGRVTISILCIGPSQVRIGITAPCNVNIDRWDRLA